MLPSKWSQRGNERQPTFHADGDRVCYLTDLNKATLHVDCRVDVYVLITNHVQLMMAPTQIGQTSHVMQSMGPMLNGAHALMCRLQSPCARARHGRDTDVAGAPAGTDAGRCLTP